MFSAPRRRAEPIIVDVVDDDASLAHGVVVETHIVARLARVPLLRIDGNVVLIPAHSVRSTRAAPPGPSAATPSKLHPGEQMSLASTSGDESSIGANLLVVAQTLARLRKE